MYNFMKSPLQELRSDKVNSYKKELKEYAQKIWNKIEMLNAKYINSGYRHEKLEIGYEIDYLENQLKKIETILIEHFIDDESTYYSIEKQKKDINELEHSIRTWDNSRGQYAKLFNRKLNLNLTMSEYVAKKMMLSDLSKGNFNSSFSVEQPQEPNNIPQEPKVIEKIVEVEKLVKVPVPVHMNGKPKVIEKIVEKEVPVEVEKLVEVAVPYPVEKLVEVQVPYPVEKIVEVDNLINVPTPYSVPEYIEVPKYEYYPQPQQYYDESYFEIHEGDPIVTVDSDNEGGIEITDSYTY